ncbi:MAG: DNA repair protein RecN [Lachnospiraceae bacterium]|nr:DNA repair protein RecN [Lachnospiraceae bacterium]
MLKNLHVKNLALIDEAEVEFDGGLNILTGETGAGKSIIIDSINLALGEKVPKEMIRDEEIPALVELTFSVDNEFVENALKEADIYPVDNEVLLSRKIVNGRAVSRINGETVTAKELKAAADVFIDIYGQQESQILLNRHKHMELLDSFCIDEIGPEKVKMQELYNEYHALLKEYNDSDINEADKKKEEDLLSFETSEIEAANLKENEDVEVENHYNRMLNSKKVAEAVSLSLEAFFSEGFSVSDCIGRAIREFAPISDFDEEAANIYSQLTTQEDLLNDLSHALSNYRDSLEFSEEDFYATEERLNVINHLKDKYGNSIEEINASYEKRMARLKALEDIDNYRNELKAKLDDAEKRMLSQCEILTNIRKKNAASLTFKVTQCLIDLNFLDVKFDMSFEECVPNKDGKDTPYFIISLNPGEPLKPLEKIASGGELSRIMLALKSVLAKNEKTGTLIFDEIDSGISGRTAQMVSEKINEISRDTQVILITHLPQIAAMADTHFLIEKNVVDSATISSIKRINEEETVKELARMLGGVSVTDTVISNAREMRELALREKIR